MGRIARSRLRHLEQRMNVHGPPSGRLLFLLLDLWPPEDQALFHDSPNLEALGDLVERRTGVRPTFGMPSPWAITVPVPTELLTLSEAEKAAYLEQHETRPIAPDTWG